MSDFWNMSDFGKKLGNVTADLLSNSNFINRSVGMANSYEDIMFIVQALGREPISLLGKDYLYIFDHVRRNYNMGTNVMNQYHNDCPKFTFYKEKPTVRFANPYDDPMNLLDRWVPEATFESTSQRNILLSYAESQDDETNNKEIGTKYDIDSANPGVNFGGISSFANVLPTCDILKKTNDNFNYGKYKTLIARFHTKSMDSRDKNDITQTAISDKYGMSHGRNLLTINKTEKNGYDNPYCTRCNSKMGLPVGAISNPGFDSIIGAIEYENNGYLYFVADCKGKTYFAKSYSEFESTIRNLRNQGLWCEVSA